MSFRVFTVQDHKAQALDHGFEVEGGFVEGFAAFDNVKHEYPWRLTLSENRMIEESPAFSLAGSPGTPRRAAV